MSEFFWIFFFEKRKDKIKIEMQSKEMRQMEMKAGGIRENASEAPRI